MLLLLGACALWRGPAGAKDIYRSVGELRRHRIEGRDFRVLAVERGAQVLVLAVHGGTIEPGTSEIARALAGEDWNLYLFEGLDSRRPKDLHVTSKRFDDPAAVALATAAVVAVSIHGEKDKHSEVCVGGGHERLPRETARVLKAAGFPVEFPCRLPGTDPRNIVNRARRGGLQLEISLPLRQSLLKDAELLAGFCRAVRTEVLRELGR